MMNKDKLYDRFMKMELEERKSFLFGIYCASCEYFAKIIINALKK